MKQIIIILLSLFTTQLVAQTNLDSMLFNKINEYRISNGLNEIAWDSKIFKVSNHHSTYLSILNSDSLKTIITHTEDANVKGFDELKEFYDRFEKYAPRKGAYTAENVTGTLKKKNFPTEDLIDIIFDKWKMSKKHNAIMLNPKLKYGACSIVVFVKGFYTSSKNYVKPITMQRSFATLNVSN